jgi:hypothetical protein
MVALAECGTHAITAAALGPRKESEPALARALFGHLVKGDLLLAEVGSRSGVVAGITLLRPSRKREKARYGEPTLKKVRQLIRSVNDTLKGQLDLEGHGGRSCAGVAIWLNNLTGAPITRSLIAYDH